MDQHQTCPHCQQVNKVWGLFGLGTRDILCGWCGKQFQIVEVAPLAPYTKEELSELGKYEGIRSTDLGGNDANAS